MATFAEVVDSADALSPEEQKILIEILQARLRERRRDDLAAEIQHARAEFAEGNIKPASVEEIMAKVQS